MNTKLLLSLILVVILFHQGSTQTIVFEDDFSTNQNATYTTAGQIGASSWYISRSGVDWGGRRNTNSQLELANDVGATANVNGWSFAYADMSSFASPYNTTLNLNSGLITWTFNIRQARTDPAGFGAGSYGAAFILAGSSTTTNNTGSGYGIAYGQSGTTDPIRLIKYANGLSGTLTNIIVSNTAGLTDFGAEYISVKVTFLPSTNTWELFLRSDGSSSFADPTSGTLVSQGTATDNTNTGISLSYIGYHWNGSTAATQTAFGDNVKVTVTASNTPTITVTPLTLSGFTYIVGNGPSAEQSFSISGENLSNDISITPPTNYEISTGTGGSFSAANPITLSQSGGTVSSTTIYVRLKAGLSVASYNSETITASSTGATSKTVTCSGSVTTQPEPTNHPTSFIATTNSTSQITVSWSNNDGAQAASGYLLMANTTGTFTSPVDGTAQSDDTDMSDNAGDKNVTPGTGTSSYAWEGLSASTTYYFKVFAYNGSSTAINYKTDGTVPTVNATTSSNYDNSSTITDPTSQVVAGNISSLADTQGEVVAAFRFKVNDLGGDLTATKVTKIKLFPGASNTAVWTDQIQGIFLNDGTSNISPTATSITDTYIELTINPANMIISEGTSQEYTVYVYLNNSLIVDGTIISMKIASASHGCTTDASSSGFSASFSADVNSNNNTIAVIATAFHFTSGPTTTSINTNFSASIDAKDTNGNLDLNGSISATLSISAGTLTSVTGLTQSTASGVYSWSDLQCATAGTGLTLTVSGTITSATTSTFTLYDVQPATQASALTFADITTTSMTVNWTNGSGTTRILVAKAGAAPGTPTDGTTYSANSVFGSGSSFGASEYVLYKGTSNSAAITGLTASTTYQFKVFEFNGENGTENYLTTSNNTSQSTSKLTYYSTGDNDPGVLANWNTARDGSGSIPLNWTSGEVFVIENGDSLSTTGTWTLSGTSAKLWLEEGGILLANHAITIPSGGYFQLDNNSKYYHSNTGAFASTIFQGTESIATGSTIELKSWNTTGPSGIGFGNLIINSTIDPGGSLQFGGGLTTVNGNLVINASGTGKEARLASSTSPSITINGNVIITGGTLNLSSSTGITIINLGGNLEVSGGTLTESGTGSGKIIFNKAGTQTFTSGGTISNTISFEVASTTVLDLGSSVLSGGGNFTLNAGAGIKTAHTNGLNGAITLTGTKTLSSSANYFFSGTGSQVTGALLPATINDLNIAGSSNLTVSNAGLLTVSNDLNIDGGASLSVSPSQYLTVIGDISNLAGNSGLLLSGDATGTATLLSSSAASATQQRSITAYSSATANDGWNLIAAPMSNADVDASDFTSGTYDLYRYDEDDNAWRNQENIANASLFDDYVPGIGYLYATNTTATKNFTGQLNAADVTISGLTKTNDKGQGWQLLGNPFPANLVWNTGWTLTNIGGTAQVLKADGTGYTTKIAGDIIAANQGIFVQISEAPGSLTIPITAATHSAASFSAKSEISDLIARLFVDETRNAETRILFHTLATDDFDWDFDANYLAPFNAEIPNLYTLINDSVKLALNALDFSVEKTIPICMKVSSQNTLKFTIDGIETLPANIDLLLHDYANNQIHNLSNLIQVNLLLNPDDETNRFNLEFKDATVSSPEESNQSIDIYSCGNLLILTNTSSKAESVSISVYNLAGQILYAEQLSSFTGEHQIQTNLPASVYLVKVNNGEKLMSKRVFIN